MAHYAKLIAWQKAIQLVLTIYKSTSNFPREEIYGLTSQLRRAAVSIPSNIAEGHGRASFKEFHHFLANARGSLMEVEIQLVIARELGYLTKLEATEALELAAELGRILTGLRDSIRRLGNE